MNYIKQLEQDKQELKDRISAIEEQVMDLRRYLQSEKFWQDTTVQVGDVFSRLEGI